MIVQVNLSTMLQHGDGCARDTVQAERWCVLVLHTVEQQMFAAYLPQNSSCSHLPVAAIQNFT
jgi:hypothetical protein